MTYQGCAALPGAAGRALASPTGPMDLQPTSLHRPSASTSTHQRPPALPHPAFRPVRINRLLFSLAPSGPASPLPRTPRGSVRHARDQKIAPGPSSRRHGRPSLASWAVGRGSWAKGWRLFEEPALSQSCGERRATHRLLESPVPAPVPVSLPAQKPSCISALLGCRCRPRSISKPPARRRAAIQPARPRLECVSDGCGFCCRER